MYKSMIKNEHTNRICPKMPAFQFGREWKMRGAGWKWEGKLRAS